MKTSEIKELLQEMLADSHLMEEAVKTAVQGKMEYMWVRTMQEWFKNKAKELADKYAEGYIEAHVADVCSKPVEVSDGWSKETVYENMDEFIKAEIRNKLSSNWGVQKAVTDYIKGTLSKMIDGILKEKATGLAGEILEDLKKGFAANDIKGEKTK